MSDAIIELDRKISRAIDRGNGVKLSIADLDLLVSIGSIDALKAGASKALTERAEQRRREREERRPTVVRSPVRRASREDAKEALRLARMI